MASALCVPRHANSPHVRGDDLRGRTSLWHRRASALACGCTSGWRASAGGEHHVFAQRGLQLASDRLRTGCNHRRGYECAGLRQPAMRANSHAPRRRVCGATATANTPTLGCALLANRLLEGYDRLWRSCRAHVATSRRLQGRETVGRSPVNAGSGGVHRLGSLGCRLPCTPHHVFLHPRAPLTGGRHSTGQGGDLRPSCAGTGRARVACVFAAALA